MSQTKAASQARTAASAGLPQTSPSGLPQTSPAGLPEAQAWTVTGVNQLVINADDFGLTDGVSSGILEAMQRGIVSSTSAMVCDRRALAWMERASTALQDRVGVHLQLTGGRPCSDPRLIPSLVTEQGAFPRLPVPGRRLQPDEVRREWSAQMESFLSTGLQPVHVDTHHHVHSISGVFEIFCEIASRYNMRARTLDSAMTAALRRRGIACTDGSDSLGEDNTPEGFWALLETAFTGGSRATLELICHPGYADADLEAKSAYVAGREDELRLLCAPDLQRQARERGIEIISVAGM